MVSLLHIVCFRGIVIGFLLAGIQAAAQPAAYTSAQAHAHNDYLQVLPFWDAYNHGFGSIEADVFLHNGQLLVAHEAKELSLQRNLESMYLQPIDSILALNSGFIYADTTLGLQLMIDIKSDAVPALQHLILLLQKYPAIMKSKSIKIAISGNRPVPEHFHQYPSYIYFDGLPDGDYKTSELERIAMISDNFRKYSAWNGQGNIPAEERNRLQQVIERAHAAGKKMRLWNAPDNAGSWCVLMSIGADYINTDQIAAISSFLKKFNKCK